MAGVSPIDNYMLEMYMDDNSGGGGSEIETIDEESEENEEEEDEERLLDVEPNPYLQRRRYLRGRQRRRLLQLAVADNDSPDLMAAKEKYEDLGPLPVLHAPQDHTMMYGMPPYVHNEEYVPAHSLLRGRGSSEKSRSSSSTDDDQRPDLFMEEHHNPPPLVGTKANSFVTNGSPKLVLNEYDMVNIGNMNDNGHRLLVAPLVAAAIVFVIWIGFWMEKRRDTAHRQYLRRHKSDDNINLDSSDDEQQKEDDPYDDWGWLLNPY